MVNDTQTDFRQIEEDSTSYWYGITFDQIGLFIANDPTGFVVFVRISNGMIRI